MTDTSVASDFLQTFDVHSDLSSKITFNNLSLIDYSTDSLYFFVRDISYTGVRIYICLFQNTVSTSSSDSVNVS